MQKTEAGFTMVELLLVVAILSVVLTGMVQLFIYTAVQTNLAANKTAAISEAQDKIEEIRDHSYSLIRTDYVAGGTPGNIFTPTLVTGKGNINVTQFFAGSNELLQVKIVVCWRDKYNRIIGEDQNLNGTLDAGEDLDGDSEIDSPVTLVSLITRR